MNYFEVFMPIESPTRPTFCACFSVANFRRNPLGDCGNPIGHTEDRLHGYTQYTKAYSTEEPHNPINLRLLDGSADWRQQAAAAHSKSNRTA